MKGIIVVSLILIVLVFFSVWLWLAVMPRACADNLLSIASTQIPVYLDDGEYTASFVTLEPGVSADDRLFLMQKTVAFVLWLQKHPEHGEAYRDFANALLAAAADERLSLSESSDLRWLHEDILPRDEVLRWFDRAMELAKEENDPKLVPGTN